MQSKRIDSLDYLRGLMALSIMIYHYSLFTVGEIDSTHLFGKLGVYGVSVFYILSGLTLYVVYNQKLEVSQKSLGSFFIKRIFRIFPLLWIASIGALLLSKQVYDFRVIFLNFSGLFGFIDPSAYLATGAWSIGNELVFYIFFPIFIFLAQRSRLLFSITIFIVFSIAIYFAFLSLSRDNSLQYQWTTYVNPFNQLYLFLGGIAIGYFFNKKAIYSTLMLRLILIITISAFIFYPVEGNTINIVTAWNRIGFSLIGFIVCTCIYLDHYQLPSFIHTPLQKLGEISYSVYLLHPLIYITLAGINKHLHLGFKTWTLVIIASVGTFIGSFVVYKMIEIPFMNLGKKVTDKIFSDKNKILETKQNN